MSRIKLGLFSAVALSFVNLAHAQTATPTAAPSNILITEGIGDDVDRGHRNPTLSVEVKHVGQGIKILADATVSNEGYAHFPIKFEFFVNRKLFATQIRTTALPGPVGVDIGRDVAEPPFNYTAVATLLHPNRQFTTIIEGSVYAVDLATNFDCSITRPADSEDSVKLFTENGVNTIQSGNDTLSLAVNNAKSTGGGLTATLNGSVVIKLSDYSATATLSYIEGSAEAVSLELSGSVTVQDGKLSSLSLSSADGETTVRCS
ncbi:MAG: hypothetical protein K1X79_02125 [Oligoflexia bacterium]|nr:hypothetical protein [Oligoflexia bacterium]